MEVVRESQARACLREAEGRGRRSHTDGQTRQTEPLWVRYSEQRGSLRQGTLVEIWAR